MHPKRGSKTVPAHLPAQWRGRVKKQTRADECVQRHHVKEDELGKTLLAGCCPCRRLQCEASDQRSRWTRLLAIGAALPHLVPFAVARDERNQLQDVLGRETQRGAWRDAWHEPELVCRLGTVLCDPTGLPNLRHTPPRRVSRKVLCPLELFFGERHPAIRLQVRGFVCPCCLGVLGQQAELDERHRPHI